MNVTILEKGFRILLRSTDTHIDIHTHWIFTTHIFSWLLLPRHCRPVFREGKIPPSAADHLNPWVKGLSSVLLFSHISKAMILLAKLLISRSLWGPAAAVARLLCLIGGLLFRSNSTEALQHLASTIILISQIVLEGATCSDLSRAVLSKLGHRWDNDFYKQHFDERRGKERGRDRIKRGIICKMHKGSHKHVGSCIWNKLKRCLII